MSEKAPGTDGLPGSRPASPEEELFTLLVDSVQDYAIFALDPAGYVISWNRGAEQIKGYRADEIIGRSYRIFYSEEARAREEPEQQLEAAAREGRFEGEGWRLRKDGRRFWARVVITALRAEDGTLVGFGKVTSDLTAERRAATRLRRRERQLAEAQQIAHLGSWEWVIAEDRFRWSEELYRIHGLEPGEPLDVERFRSLVHPEDRDAVEAALTRVIDPGHPFAIEYRIVRPTGDLRWVQGRGEAVADDQGRIHRAHGTALDITELKEAEQQARQLAAERSARAEAERTALRMGFLAEASALLGGSLEYEETLRTIAWLAVPSFADWCAVDVLGPDGGVTRLAAAHIDPERVALAEELGNRREGIEGPEPGLSQVLGAGEPELLVDVPRERLESAARNDDELRLLEELGFRSAIIVPIQVRDRTMGAITFVNAESDRRYASDDLVVAQELAARAALAVENAQLHTAEREARHHAERARERMSRLQAITAGLSEAVTPEGVAQVIVDQGVAALAASTGVLALTEGDGTARIVRSVGLPDDVIQEFQAFDLDAPIPLADAIRSGETLLVDTSDDGGGRYAELEPVRRRTGTRAVAAVPLRSGERVIGGLAFGYATARPFGQEDRLFVQALGRQCAQALERAWLYETEHLARETAEAASRAKSQFVAMMSHELRTPLSAILGYEELLAEGIVGPVTERQKQQLDRIRASATHLRDLINQILSFSRIEAGKEEVFPEEVDVAELTRDVALLMEREVEAKGLTMNVRTPPGPLEVSTDPGKVRQILLNLLSNAVKFTEEGGIQLQLETDGDEFVIRVRDTGIGISGPDRERIFDAFTQLDQSMTRRVGGSGLGLPVSRRLAQLLGGSLVMESAVGKGSTFELRLPRDL